MESESLNVLMCGNARNETTVSEWYAFTNVIFSYEEQDGNVLCYAQIG